MFHNVLQSLVEAGGARLPTPIEQLQDVLREGSPEITITGKR